LDVFDIVVYGLVAAPILVLIWFAVLAAQGRLSWTLVYFSVSLFVSAFLLFLVQPMIGKMILPRLGGTPQVWNTCMMFFQTVLLAGYAYTHYVTRNLPLKKQLMVHCVALLLPVVVLLMFGRPFNVTGFGAVGGGNPIFQTLALLALIVGIPFLIVSTNAPLLQRWFANTGDKAAQDPYFLYGASNVGSILGLLLYPALVERELGLNDQAWFWLGGFIVLAILVAGCAFRLLKVPPTVQLPGPAAEQEPPPPELPVPPEPMPAPSTATTATPPAPAAPRVTSIRRGGKRRGARGPAIQAPAAAAAGKAGTISIKKPAVAAHHMEVDEGPFEMTPLRRLRWVGLAAVPTSLMLGCTTYISTDISPVPLLWIIPLTLYLLSFVFVFSRWPVPWVGVGRNPGYWTPHKIVLILQLVALPMLMLLIMTDAYNPPERAMMVSWVAFFITALACHGELARDRPPPQFLTEFYLWMSVGGMLGGTFNALFAPLIPWFGLFEFPLALVLAAIVRPGFRGENWTDKLIGVYQSPSGTQLSYVLDFILPVLILFGSYFMISHSLDRNSWNLNTAGLANPSDYAGNPDAYKQIVSKYSDPTTGHPLFRFFYSTIGLPGGGAYVAAKIAFILITYGLLACALLSWKRPIRMGLGLGAVLLASGYYTMVTESTGDHQVLYRDRSYFGILRVMQDQARYKSGDVAYRYTYLMHGSTHHGLNYQFPDGSVQNGKKTADFTRLATTYYHRFGPVGVVMEKLNWFPGYKYNDGSKDVDDRMTYWADARLPASLVGSGAANFGMLLPLPQIVSAWSEPAYATIGLGTGTMASYSRPFQHMTFYEIDQHIRNFSLPPEGRETYYTYVQGALRRGTKLEIIMGDARLTMSRDQLNTDGTYYVDDFSNADKHDARVPWKTSTSFNNRESYYRAMEVDAFSSDAIPVHLITKEAIELYMDKLTPNGVLLVHTSNRHVNLVQPVIQICQVAQWRDWENMKDGEPTTKTGLAWVICKDSGREGSREIDFENPSNSGHFGSEYVLVARKREYLPPYALTEEQKAFYKSKGAYVMSYSPEQQRAYESFGLKTYPRGEEPDGSKRLFSSTIDFYDANSWNNDEINRIWSKRTGERVMQFYGYYVPPNARVWTDDYSNILSVFRFHSIF
jgi:hypothetical protein